MHQLISSYKKSEHLHHAYFLVGDGQCITQDLIDFLENSVGVKKSGNPDFQIRTVGTFAIDDARVVSDFQHRKSFSGGKKIFIIEADTITEEAQSSLLKVFEEPTAGTHFFIISPQDILLPTFRSRMQVIQVENVRGKNSKADSILNLKLKERLERVKEIIDGISDEEQTKQDAISFLNQIEKELHGNGIEESSLALEVCQLARESLYDRGAPVKMILENVVLTV